MIKINRKEIIDLFDTKKDDLRHDISSVINLVGEDLGASLFKHYYERTNKGCKVTISQSQVLGKTLERKGPRLDRWIFIEQSKNKRIGFQTEIKNWSAYAIGARPIKVDSNLLYIGKSNWDERLDSLSERKRNGESKVFFPMQDPKEGLPAGAKKNPLIIYWFVLSQNGKSKDIFFKVPLSRKGFRNLYVFSMSNYLRSIKDKELTLDMPNVEKRSYILNKRFVRSKKKS